MNGIEEKQLTKTWLNVFTGSISKKILCKICLRKMMGFDNQKKFLKDLDLLTMKKNYQSNLWRMFVLSFLLCINVQK